MGDAAELVTLSSSLSLTPNELGNLGQVGASLGLRGRERKQEGEDDLTVPWVSFHSKNSMILHTAHLRSYNQKLFQVSVYKSELRKISYLPNHFENEIASYS